MFFFDILVKGEGTDQSIDSVFVKNTENNDISRFTWGIHDAIRAIQTIIYNEGVIYGYDVVHWIPLLEKETNCELARKECIIDIAVLAQVLDLIQPRRIKYQQIENEEIGELCLRNQESLQDVLWYVKSKYNLQTEWKHNIYEKFSCAEALLKDIQRIGIPDKVSRIEHKIAWIVGDLERSGVPYNESRADMLERDLRVSLCGYINREIDDDVLADTAIIQSRLDQLNAWYKAYNKETGRVYYNMTGCGTITGRATHYSPNIAQVPSVGSKYGWECRSLFGVPNGWVQVGADICGLELRCLAHYMSRYDNGEYGRLITGGDIHTHNMEVLGLTSRDQAKRLIYAILYGAGNERIGEIVGGDREAGQELKNKFFSSNPAFKQLKDAVERRADTVGYISSLDGRKINTRSTYAALNLLLQSAGAVICKHWVSILNDRLRKIGLTQGWDGDYVLMLWIHDEVQIACRTQCIADTVAAEAQIALNEAKKCLGVKVRLDLDVKTGKTWAECH